MQLIHQQKFLSYHINRVFDDCSLVFKKKNKIIAVLSAAINNYNNQKTFFGQ